MEKVAVIKRLQSQITELQIARGNERLPEHRQVKLEQFFIEKSGPDAALHKNRKIARIARGHLRMRDFFAQRFAAQNMEQNARRGPAVRGLLFDQRARRENRTVIYLLQRRPSYRFLSVCSMIGSGFTAAPSPSHACAISAVSASRSSGRLTPSSSTWSSAFGAAVALACRACARCSRYST